MLLDDLFLSGQICETDLTPGTGADRAPEWIKKVYDQYPATWQRNHVMIWGEGDDQELAMFELVPNPARPNHVEVKWFQAYPLRRGVGTRAMRELQRLAQEDGIVLTLYAWDKGQVSRSQLIKFYRSVGFRPTATRSASMSWQPHQVDEGWREKLAGAAAVATLGYGGLHNYQAQQPLQQAAPQIKQQRQTADTDQRLYKFVPPEHHVLLNTARRAGLTGTELEHLLAQVKAETGQFRHMEEQPPQGARNPQRYFAKKYDRKKILGNVRPGDGYRFRGRGYIQLTGRDNYTRAGRALGLDLVNNPDLAAEPHNAARIAIWFWKNRVAPRVTDFDSASVQDVTRGINPAQKGAEKRAAYFQRVSQPR